MRMVVVVRTVVAVMGVLAVSSAMATAQDVRSVFVPMTFYTEAGAIRTTACLQLTERVSPQTAWWDEAGGNASGPEQAFKSVIAAIKRKDRAALLKLTDPAQGRDPTLFDKQAGAFFQQFDVIQLVTASRAYEFDGLVVFFAGVQAKGRTAFVPFTFAQEDNGTFGFLPSRTDKLTYVLVNDWFSPIGGPPPTDTPTYCADAEVKRATHRIALAPSGAAHPSYVLLTGASIDAPGTVARLAPRVKSTIQSMKASLRGNGVDEFVRHLTLEGGSRLKEWFATASQTERDQYKTAILGEQPFFLFDESPLVVVYTKSPEGAVHVLYFTVSANGELLWTNSSHVTVADQVFKKSALFDAASSDRPFSALGIR
jgi:hypothetical protein